MIRVRLAGRTLLLSEGRRSVEAVPSMEHPDFQRVLKDGWVSPPSFGPSGDLRVYSAAHTAPGSERYAWFASADWRRGRIQVDRQGAISDVAMEPYGGGKGKVRGEPVDISVDYARRALSVTVGEEHSAIGKWTDGDLELEVESGASRAVDAALAAALFLWCTRPEAFLVRATPPF